MMSSGVIMSVPGLARYRCMCGVDVFILIFHETLKFVKICKQENE